MTEIKINDELAQKAKKYFENKGLNLTQGIDLLLNVIINSQDSNLAKLINQCNQDDPEIVTSLNSLFKKLDNNSHNKNGIGNSILDEHHSSTTNGIGNNILR